MPNIDLSILNQKATPAFFADTLANRPAPSFVGRIFISTDTLDLYRDTGTAWLLLSPSSTGTITGLGAAGQVTYFSGTSSITGSNDLFWDSVNGHLGINTNTPGTALDVHHDQPTIAILNQTIATNDVRIGFQNNGVGLWRIGAFYNAGANDFAIFDAVNSLERFSVKNTGQTFVGAQTTTSGRFVVNNATSDNHIVVIGATAPSIRINNSGTGATRLIGLGLATGVNNFIQGTTGGEMAIFNSSTTASPILFGIYDAGLSNTQEAARISAARNFLIGTTTDAGYKLDVNGISRVTGNFSVFNGNVYAGVGGPAANRGFYAGNTGFEASFLYNNSTGNLDISPRIGFNTIITSGNVGIGTTSPLQSSGNRTVLTLNNISSNIVNFGINNTLSCYIYSDNSNSGIYAQGNLFLQADGVNYTAFVNNGSERARITSSGNLLIGTTTDAGQKLQVNGNASVNGTVIAGDFLSASGTVSNPFAVWTTMFTIAANQTAIYQLIAVSPGNGLTYTASATIVVNSAAIELRNYVPGGALILQVSGYDIQCQNGSGSTLAIQFKYIRIS